MVKRKATEVVDMELQERTFGTNHVKSFSGMSTVTLVDLRARIDEFEGESGVEVDLEKIKLARLYFASAVLGPRRKRKKEVVDPQWMRLVDDMDSFNTYSWGRLAYDEALFGLRKDLGAICEEFTNLAKKRKRDPKFSGFGSLHLSGDTTHVGVDEPWTEGSVQPTVPQSNSTQSNSSQSTSTQSNSSHSTSVQSKSSQSTSAQSTSVQSNSSHQATSSQSTHASPTDHDVAAASQYHGCTEKPPVSMLIVKSIVEDKRARSPVITTGGMTASPETAERANETPSTDSPDGFEFNLSMLPPVREGESDWPNTPWDKEAFILVPYCFNSHWVLVKIVPKVKKLTVLDSDHNSSGKQLLNLIMPLARMVPHILMAMGVQTGTATRWNIVRPKEFTKQSLSGECGVYAIAAAAFTLSERNVYTLNDAEVEAFRKFCACSLWSQSWMLD
ncbi:hypothetical protein F511_29888 [Dorcoceras hygrometricum]|uniref:Ubiquitin-like protease family profile domain-containing protein n=1 Tax=Dorcoceras hygrometricum TaxID=472368 RepID=A0A2Z7BZ50_9LAMI|nr:hypothetical protein F511_29888 [Dorcoceras hygrometricum]